MRQPTRPGAHRDLLDELSFLDDVEVGAPPASCAAPDGLRVVCWNAERGRAFAAGAAMLERQRADVMLLQELDFGMARSQQRHTARELARALGGGYAYGIEFLELGLGDERERARHAGDENQVGYHGAAILSPLVLRAPELVRLERSGRWFDGTLGERRIGGRMALVAGVEVAGREISVASVHLESHSDPDERAAQLAVLLDVIERRAPGAPALIGGDLNTSSLSRRQMRDRRRLTEALRVDPERLASPVPHEPLFALAARAGYDWRLCNRAELSTQRLAEPPPSARGTLHLDWFLARGLVASGPDVLRAADPGSGEALSDHEPIAVRVVPGARLL